MKVGDLIEVDERVWRVVASAAGEVALCSIDARRIRTCSAMELLGLPVRSARGQGPPTVDHAGLLDQLSADQRAEALFWQTHLHEVLTGRPSGAPDGYEPRAAFSPDCGLSARVAAKSAELRKLGFPVSERSLWRRLKRYREQGLPGLVDGRALRTWPFTGQADLQLLSVIEAVLDRQTKISTGTRSRAIAAVRLAAADLGLEVPCDRTLYRWLDGLERQRHSFGNATVRRTQANRPDRAYGRQTPLRPGELVEIDSTPLDVMVLYPDGKAGRPDLTIAVDVATRTICAAILRPVATKAVDAAVLLARAMTPLPIQPGWVDALALSRALLPHAAVAGEDELRSAALERPLIPIESVTIDRGRVFVSTTFMAACERLQISVTLAAPRTPTDKPHVERLFGSINSLFVQYLAGYTGPNVVRRGQDVAAEAVWPLAQVQDLLDQWIVQVWQNRPHSGLQLPAVPLQHLTPNEMFHALSATAPAVAPVFDVDDYIALLPAAWRRIQHYGVNLHGLAYDSPALDPHRNRRSGLHRGEARDRWEVRYDPYRLNEVFVRDHEQQRWIRAPWTLAGQVAGPFSIDVLHAARQAVARRQPGQERSAVALLAEVNRICTQLTLDNAAERSAARRQPPALFPTTVPALSLAPDPAAEMAFKSSVDPAGADAFGDAEGELELEPSDMPVPTVRGKTTVPPKIARILYDDPSPDPPVRRR